MRLMHLLIGVEGGVSCGISGTVETPQERFLRRGDSTPAPRKASAWNANLYYSDFNAKYSIMKLTQVRNVNKS